MIRRLVLLLLLVQAPALAAESAADKYQALVTAAKRGDKPVDWQALRFAYADSPAFDVIGMQTADQQKKMFEAFKRADYAGALAQAKLILDQVFVDIDAHQIAHLAYGKLGNAALDKHHYDIMTGLLKSIMTGDGRTPETAFTVISVGEEYSLLRALGLRPGSQSLIKSGGHAYDKLDVRDSDGTPYSFYFLIDRVLAAEAAALQGKQ